MALTKADIQEKLDRLKKGLKSNVDEEIVAAIQVAIKEKQKQLNEYDKNEAEYIKLEKRVAAFKAITARYNYLKKLLGKVSEGAKGKAPSISPTDVIIAIKAAKDCKMSKKQLAAYLKKSEATVAANIAKFADRNGIEIGKAADNKTIIYFLSKEKNSSR